MKLHLPRRINVQIGLLLVLCVLLLHGAVTAILYFSSPGPGGPRNHAADAALVALAALDAAPSSDRPKVVAAMAKIAPELDLSLAVVADANMRAKTATSPELDFIRSHSPAGATIEPASNARKAIVTLGDGQKISFSMPGPGPGPGPGIGPALTTIGFVGVSLMIFSFWAAMSVTRPLTRFASAAEAFALDHVPVRLDEGGPEEVSKAARAFNRMQNRISEMAARQTRMLAAVSHDLRTPITRMRLRAEFIEDGEARAKLLRDLDQMDGMVHSCLSFLRGGARQAFTRVDMASLLSTVADQFADTGADVRFGGGAHLVVNGNPDDLERAFSNLADNAVKFAGGAMIALSAMENVVVVEIVDTGPGIPADARQAMLAPFERGDPSRQHGPSQGFGLGLSIAQAIVEAHGGKLELDERVGGGLLARVVLPRSLLSAVLSVETI